MSIFDLIQCQLFGLNSSNPFSIIFPQFEPYAFITKSAFLGGVG